MTQGFLYICPTPIGNLKDISLRIIEVFKESDYIAAEDTRHSGKLLEHLEISKPFISYHEHNYKSKGEEIIGLLKRGKKIALVSDAGMPGISDPGSQLVKECIEEGIDFTVLPGPTALINALVLSGLNTDKFSFQGFLPSKASEKKEELERVKYLRETLIFYEAPHRLVKTLESMLDILGNRKIAISREITKLYEETIRMNIEESIDYFKAKKPRGEFVLVVEGNKEERLLFENLTIREHLDELINNGYSKKDAVKEVSEKRNIPKNLVYKESIDEQTH